jgi:hypothetical protein
MLVSLGLVALLERQKEGEGEDTYSVWPLEKANLSLTCGRKQILFPKHHVFYLLEYRMMEKVQKPSNSVCYTTSSEPFRIYFYLCVGNVSTVVAPCSYGVICVGAQTEYFLLWLWFYTVL